MEFYVKNQFLAQNWNEWNVKSHCILNKVGGFTNSLFDSLVVFYV